MEKWTDVVIVAIFGRGHWLAQELAKKGWKVTLIDVSSQMGPWEPEDCEGPFGILESSDLMPSQLRRLEGEGEAQPVPQGMSFLLPDGPLECRSELTAFQLEKRGVPEAVESYLRLADPPTKDSEKVRRQLKRMSYSDTWLAHLSHQLASTVFVENHRAIDQGRVLPFFAPLMIRHATEAGWRQGLESCRAAGVTVRTQASIRDVRFSYGVLDALEVKDERAGVVKGKTFVWMLSSDETRRCPPGVQGRLYPRGAVAPDWYWARYRLDLKQDVPLDQIPRLVVGIRDPHLPWTHSNLFIMRQRPETSGLDVWMRLPCRMRFSLEYHQKISSELVEFLQKRLPRCRPQLALLPLEVRLGESQVSAPRFPVFSPEARASVEPRMSRNLFFDSPEQWSSLDWLGQYRNQSSILLKLVRLKTTWEEAARRALQEPRGGRVSP